MDDLTEKFKEVGSAHIDELSGMRGLKQLWRRFLSSMWHEDVKEEIFSRHSGHFLNRCFSDWKK